MCLLIQLSKTLTTLLEWNLVPKWSMLLTSLWSSRCGIRLARRGFGRSHAVTTVGRLEHSWSMIYPGEWGFCPHVCWTRVSSGWLWLALLEHEIIRCPLGQCVWFLFSRETYNSLTNWLTDARTLASPNIVIVLVGNKKDLEADREVTFMEASRFAQENGKWSGSWKNRVYRLSVNSVFLQNSHFLRQVPWPEKMLKKSFLSAQEQFSLK